MAGPALTVKLRPGDNLMLHKALDLAEPGDVIVADAGGDLTTAIMGDLMLNHAIRRGIGGIVINGAVRDVDSIRALDLPVYAAGVTHRGPYKDGPGEINVPVALDGMVVEPGDLVLGDADGVLVVPRLAAAEILALAETKQAAEAREMAAIREGTSDRSWVDKALQARGCSIED
jgi:RraA family protein